MKKTTNSRKVIVYTRYSSDNQREESITAQLRACTEYADRNGYIIIKVYTDEAKSAQTDDRPNFLQMIYDIKFNQIEADIVLVHKLDRFARNRYDSAFYKRELRKYDIRVESVLEHLDDSPESVILESVLEGMAEYYSKNLAREVIKGMKETALQAKHTGGLPPLGLDVNEDKRYVINQKEARAVMIIFKMRDSGHGYNTIINTLNNHEECFKTKAGRPFGKNSIHEILKNKKYIGTYVFNRSAAKSSNGKRNNHLTKKSDDIIEIPNAIPAIVPEDLFWRIQKKMSLNRKLNSTGGHKAKVDYLLSSLIWCGECGQKMVGSSSSYTVKSTKEKKKLHYYLCNNANRTNTCNNKKINKTDVEDYVMSKLTKEVFIEKAIQALAEKLYKHYIKNKHETSGEGDYLKKELGNTSKQIENIVDAIANGGIAVQPLLEKLKSLENSKAILESRLHEWQVKQESDTITFDKAVAYLQHYAEELKSDDPKQVKQVIERFVEKVIVKQDTIEVNLMVTVHTTGGGGGS
ncbi:MAG: recombinase family protein [Bacillota bacterium]